MIQEKTAIVTGANRGIGFETAKKLALSGIRVVLTARNEQQGKTAWERLRSQTSNVLFHQLDVTDHESVKKICEYVRKEFGRLDILVNNAGICIDRHNSISDVNITTIRHTMETNVYGPLLLCQTFVPLMKENNYGRIVNVSSGMGQLKSFVDMGQKPASCPGYRISKTALNALTRILAFDLEGTNILVNSVNPGWVQTEMGGPYATRTMAQGADSIVWLATLPDGGPTGCFFMDRKIIDW
jgi:NAD(P)-dependent dehydrogenase (short-subunit alcohol dehydrogenase family)